MTETRELVQLALKGLQAERARIDAQIAELKAQLRGGRRAGLSTRRTTSTGTRKRRRMTAAQKKAISRTMKKLWAEKRRGE